MPLLLAIPKFIGTVSLGLLTGLSYSLTQTYPTLLLLPTATHASRTFSALSTSFQSQILAFTTLALTAFSTAYALSPRAARHPYLLWTAGLAGAASAADLYAVVRAVAVGGPSTAASSGASDAGDEGWVVEEKGVNGEEVERRVREAQKREVVRGVVAAVAFTMSVVGLWGDGA